MKISQGEGPELAEATGTAWCSKSGSLTHTADPLFFLPVMQLMWLQTSVLGERQESETLFQQQRRFQPVSGEGVRTGAASPGRRCSVRQLSLCFQGPSHLAQCALQIVCWVHCQGLCADCVIRSCPGLGSVDEAESPVTLLESRLQSVAGLGCILHKQTLG